MKEKIFHEHGEISSSWINNLLVIYVEGPFNMEGIVKCSKHIKQAAEKADSPIWARIEVLLNNEAMGPAESLDIVEENIQHSKKNGCIALSVIGSNVLARERMAEMCRRCGMEFRVFNSIKDAFYFSYNKIEKS